MSFTEHGIIGSVDGCFNQNRRDPCFRYITHKTMKISVRIEICAFSCLYVHIAFNDVSSCRIFKSMVRARSRSVSVMNGTPYFPASCSSCDAFSNMLATNNIISNHKLLSMIVFMNASIKKNKIKGQAASPCVGTFLYR